MFFNNTSGKKNIKNFLENIKKTEFANASSADKFSFFTRKFFQDNLPPEPFKINMDTRCLIISTSPGYEIKGLGGLMVQFPKSFELLCLTNGSNQISESGAIKSAVIKKHQFNSVTKITRIKGSKIFDIDDNTLKDNTNVFKRIDILDVDYIFLPNFFEKDKDVKVLLENFRQILKYKEHKPELKIVLFEGNSPLPYYNYYSNISSFIETKRKLLLEYYPEDQYPNYTERLIGLNSYRSLNFDFDYAEVFLQMPFEEFLRRDFFAK